jgi:hypothetical protein
LTNEQKSPGFILSPHLSPLSPRHCYMPPVKNGDCVIARLLIQDDLQQGKLVPVLPHWQPVPVTFFALHPGNKVITVAARRFLIYCLPELGILNMGDLSSLNKLQHYINI